MLASLRCLITNFQFLSLESFTATPAMTKHHRTNTRTESEIFFSHSWVVSHVGGLTAASHLMHDESGFLSWCFSRIFPQKTAHIYTRFQQDGYLASLDKANVWTERPLCFLIYSLWGRKHKTWQPHAAFHRLQLRNIVHEALWPQGVTLLVKLVNFMAELRKSSIWSGFLLFYFLFNDWTGLPREKDLISVEFTDVKSWIEFGITVNQLRICKKKSR